MTKQRKRNGERDYFAEGRRAYERFGSLAPNPYLCGFPKTEFDRGLRAAAVDEQGAAAREGMSRLYGAAEVQ
ncbi:hypothetical protein [Burkholderia ambifaria]|uniref:hypothetical protein n=1 Tax=Burkholderia ambifaria TaxID=152480 RepID=UPI00158D10B7|nr:hypothetical protein [Burkholderia ambifaria]